MIYRGQKELQIDTELNTKKVVSKWMQWYSSMWTEPNVPPHARFDFHMSQEFKGGKENIRLFTCEVSECGVSLNLPQCGSGQLMSRHLGAFRAGMYSPNLSKCYFLQIDTKICSKVPIFYFNRPKRPPL